MSTVTYLVFENSAQGMNMDKMPVFKNGSEMPWTYYTANIEDDGTNQNEARKRLMFTSESKPSSAGALDAGNNVSQIKKYVPTGAVVSSKVQYKELTISNPKASDYESWGWKLEKDQTTGASILPKFGEFRFQPGCEPSYEDMSSMDINFRFGFGLGSTCYNFATETAKLQVYNLSCAPKLYCSTNEFCEIKYNAATNSYPELTSEVSGKDEIKCSISEGTSGAAYLFIAVPYSSVVSLK